jgi:hypothetical protein
MNEASGTSSPAVAAETCAQCGKTLTPGDRVPAGDRVFCRSCYATLRAELEQAVTTMTTDINYANAALGAVLGGIAGVLVWWGFTVMTHIAFGLIAVAIGFLVGHGAVRFAGGKHSRGLQMLSVLVALASYLCATYLVNMSFINKSFAERGEAFRVGFPPANLDLFDRVLTAGFGIMDLVFLAVVVYQAWRIPSPPVLPPELTT